MKTAMLPSTLDEGGSVWMNLVDSVIILFPRLSVHLIAAGGTQSASVSQSASQSAKGGFTMGLLPPSFLPSFLPSRRL